jgi:hypothetical protein
MLRLRTVQLYQKALAEGKVHSIMEMKRRGVGTYPTAFRYAKHGGELRQIMLPSLEWFLVNGLGIAPAELLEMRFGDIFTLEPDAPAQAASTD